MQGPRSSSTGGWITVILMAASLGGFIGLMHSAG